MNYIALLNQFWRLRREVPFSSAEADLYFYLLDISNGLNWKNPFQQSNALICATIGVSEKPLITARNRLKQHGLIDFTPGVKRNPSTYKLLLLENTLENLQPFRGECDSKSGSESGSECDSLSGENPPDINKHKLNEAGNATSADAHSPSVLNSSDSSSTTKPAARPRKPKVAVNANANAEEIAALPLPHPGDEFAQLWATFRAGPKQKGKAVSAFELILKKLAKYPEDFAVLMLERAIQANWSGVEYDTTAKAFEEWQAAQARRPTPTPPGDRSAAAPDPAPNYAFLAEQQAREQEELDRQQAEWRDTHAVAAA